jgi:hypothetical protein
MADPLISTMASTLKLLVDRMDSLEKQMRDAPNLLLELREQVAALVKYHERGAAAPAEPVPVVVVNTPLAIVPAADEKTLPVVLTTPIPVPVVIRTEEQRQQAIEDVAEGDPKP